MYRKSKFEILAICIALLCISAPLIAKQVVNQEISQDQLNSLTKQLEFDKMKRSLQPINKKDQSAQSGRKKGSRKREHPLPSQREPNAIIDSLSTLLAYSIGVILIGLILIYLVKDLRLNSKIKRQLELKDLDVIQNIEDENFEQILESTLEERDFRKSIRIQFLILLQTLAKKKLIKWKPNKTNGVYVEECSVLELKETFRSISTAFDYIWYGNKEITESDYHLIAEKVTSFQKIIDHY